MEIEVTRKSYGTILVYKDTNVLIEEDVETRTYYKDDNGKTDYLSKAPKRDIDETALDKFSQILDDLLWYRESPYDSTDLINHLFGNLHEDKAKELLVELNDKYAE